jgi:hypothetical protein
VVFWKYGVAGRCQRFTRKENLRNDITPIKIRTKSPGSCLLKTARLPGLTIASFLRANREYQVRLTSGRDGRHFKPGW